MISSTFSFEIINVVYFAKSKGDMGDQEIFF